MAGINHILLWFSCLIVVLMGHSCYSQTDRLLQGQQLKDWEELVSDFGKFKVGFFSPPSTKTRYVGIWYNTEYGSASKRVVWVGNRDTPISDKSAILKIDNSDGNLKIFHSGQNPIAITSVKGARNTSVTLLPSGNLVLHQLNSSGSAERMLWQSFDYPTDTLLPGMKLGVDLQTGHEWFLQSWLTDKSPARGSYTLRMDPNVSNQLTIWWRGEVYWTSGMLLNGRFNFSYSLMRDDNNYSFSYTWNQQEKYLTYSVNEDVSLTLFPMLQIAYNGSLGDDSKWLYPCEDSESCGHDKFSRCARGDGDFERRQGFMSGDGFKFKESDNMSLDDCSVICRKDCSCVAYAATSRENNTGCEIWSRGTKLIDSYQGNYGEIYVEVQIKDENMRLKPRQLIGAISALIFMCWMGYVARRLYCLYIEKEEKRWLSLIIGLGSLVLVAPFLYYSYWAVKAIGHKIKNRKYLLRELGVLSYSTWKLRPKTQENIESMNFKLKIFGFQTIVAATNNFSTANKLGEGGFGVVYKGKLQNGQEIAIKRLSKKSRQDLDSFKNEAKLIGKLQHTNLVRLLGVCLWKEEKILVYEYMPNKSLDLFIFDSYRRKLLNWKKHFNIIEGIAQGLLYIHRFSRLKVIHLDLKAGNILLDDQMNPKISDFGMARIFKVNELEANTSKIGGTVPYMSPEYKINGLVSEKADVYSFGILILEIVSGERISKFYNPEREVNLVGYAWQLWREGKGLELSDLRVEESGSRNEVLRCICVGLLCVQDQPNDRPTMSNVISMLTNDTVLLPPPKQPTLFIPADSEDLEALDIKSVNCSINDVTISDMEGR